MRTPAPLMAEPKHRKDGSSPDHYCILCGREVKPSARMIRFDLGHGPDVVSIDEYVEPSGEGGWWRVGEDCLRKHGLREYAVGG